MKRGEERAWEFVLTGGGIHALLCAAHIDPLGSLYLGDVFRTTNNGFILKEKKRPCHFSSASQGCLDIQCVMLSNGCQHSARPARLQWMSLLYFLHPPMFAPKNLEPGLVTRETALTKLCLFTPLFFLVKFPIPKSPLLLFRALHAHGGSQWH